MSLKESISSYALRSYRRKILDKLFNQHTKVFKGKVLDIGGRDRGDFNKPKKAVKEWIFADIEAVHHPDIVLDVANMHMIKDKSIDTILAADLFEHVEQVEKGLDECARIIKNQGSLVISVPFLHRVHGDPYDFQRWTMTKWELEFKKRHFKIKKLIVTGYFYVVLADMLKSQIKDAPTILRYAGIILLPFIDIIAWFDRFAKKNSLLNKYHCGYFIIAQKVKS